MSLFICIVFFVNANTTEGKEKFLDSNVSIFYIHTHD